MGEEGRPAVEVLDAHVHLWRLAARSQPWIDSSSMTAIHRDFTNADLEAVGVEADVRSTILVQVLNRADETSDFLRCAAASGHIDAVVGWVDLTATDIEDRLVRLSVARGGDRLVGIRHQAQAEPDPAGWLEQPSVQRGLATLGRQGYVFDLMMRPEHLARTLAVVRQHPDVTFVLDHAGKPPVLSGWDSDDTARWAALLTEFAGEPHVHVKLSGLTTMADLATWTLDDLRPYVDHLLTTFGSKRLIFGSDWPVSLRAASYRRTVDTVRELLTSLLPWEQQDVLANNARQVYGLSATTGDSFPRVTKE